MHEICASMGQTTGTYVCRRDEYFDFHIRNIATAKLLTKYIFMSKGGTINEDGNI